MNMSKVAIVKCENYDPENVYDSLKRAMDLLGGINSFVKKDEKILLKPNVLFGRAPAKGTTTHPAVFEAIIRILLDVKVKVSFGDSPGFGMPYQSCKSAGLVEIADKYNIPFADFSDGSVLSYKKGMQNKKFEIANAVQNSDGIINLPKMKSHRLTRMTGAVKNLFGCIYGVNKAAYHMKLPNPVDFSRMLVDLAGFLKPRLNIMDGIVAMEGNGPAGGDLVNMNCLIVSSDPIALDSTFCRMIDLDPEFIPTVYMGKEAGIGTFIMEEIEYVGDPLNSFVNKRFKIIRKPLLDERSTLDFLVPIKDMLIPRPYIKARKCVKCGRCVEACPVTSEKALNFRDGTKAKPPVYDYSKCIRCYCCQEMCPYDAIFVKTPLMGKVLLRRK